MKKIFRKKCKSCMGKNGVYLSIIGATIIMSFVFIFVININQQYFYKDTGKATQTQVQKNQHDNLPKICTTDYTPVCGVDNKTYPNKCNADKILIAYNGECQDLSKCTSFFDGCNNCMVDNGKITACTRKFCPEEMKEPAKCLKFIE